MPASVRFHRDLLGFRIHSHSPHRGGGDPDRFHWVWLSRGSLSLMLNTAYELDEERPIPPNPVRTAAHGDTAIYFDCSDLDAAHAELWRGAPRPRSSASHLLRQTELSLRDPDGYLICLLSS